MRCYKGRQKGIKCLTKWHKGGTLRSPIKKRDKRLDKGAPRRHPMVKKKVARVKLDLLINL